MVQTLSMRQNQHPRRLPLKASKNIALHQAQAHAHAWAFCMEEMKTAYRCADRLDPRMFRLISERTQL